MQTHTERPARVADAISSRQLAAQERKAAKARQRVRELREKASAEIERLIAFMDETDGYTMDEREPWLGAPEIAPTFSEYSEKYQMWFKRDGDQTRWAAGVSDDREADEGDKEPSLGFHIPGGGQENGGSTDDREGDPADDPRGEEVNEDGDGNPDDEPSLGWTESICQTVPNTSRELCDCEQGAGPLHRVINEGGGVSIDTSYGYTTKITGLTAQQKQALGTDWVRR
jgi:hypothetical protein